MGLMTDKAKATISRDHFYHMFISTLVGFSFYLLTHPTKVYRALVPYTPTAEAATVEPAATKGTKYPEYKVSPEIFKQVVDSGLYRIDVKKSDIVPEDYIFRIYTNNGQSMLLRVRARVCDSQDCYIIVSIEREN